ncbi:DNA-3-methyladenine glycosylase I [Ruegeria discodermiae]|uniref:DNA-3-methyladenine glycosylase I n=1 Tax=Ruegeria discodermiae TaxID=3064389 RepID=UPI0027413D54|nr:DNA-3-methyladenine glycosylase I [Ruegeria sp. 2205SS24-7]
MQSEKGSEMRHFDEIYDIAAHRKGGPDALEALLSTPRSKAELRAIPDDRWLSEMARCLFQAGFNWKVINAKWPGFEAGFDGFDPARVGFYHDDDIDRLLSDRDIVRNGAKIAAVIANARFVLDLAAKHGSAAAFFAEWPGADHIGLLQLLSKSGARLGGTTGQRMLRNMGKDGFILSPDVSARLVAEGVVDKPPTSKRDMAATQAAFNTWAEQSGRGLTQISQVLAYSV